MIIRNQDVLRVTVEIPVGHMHIRTTILLGDETELVFQEATIANIVRAYIGVKTHPQNTRIELVGKHLVDSKDGYAEWQLVEVEGGLETKTTLAGLVNDFV